MTQTSDNQGDLGRVRVVRVVGCAEEGRAVPMAVNVADEVMVRRQRRRTISEV